MISLPVLKIACIVGARPNFMKMAPILAAFQTRNDIDACLIHAGQHYDYEMNAVFFKQLGIPEPDLNLGVGSGGQTAQTAEIMLGLEAAFERDRPGLVLVVGDVNSTLAASLVAAKQRIPLAHVEAGLRSFDRDMPEEINRLVTDRLSDLLFTTERAADTQLMSEGVSSEAIHFVGNVMIDTLLANAGRAISIQETLAARGVSSEFAAEIASDYVLVTLHRPSNVDDPSQLGGLLDVLAETAANIPVLFTMHPRTKSRIDAGSLQKKIDVPGFIPLTPLSYLEMIGAVKGARMVVTDSGGLQEETTVLGVRCLTVRENTERPITITEGTNRLIGASPDALRKAIKVALAEGAVEPRAPEYWDGKAAHRIAEILSAWSQRTHAEA